MLLLTAAEFENNISKYLEIALTERVAVSSEFGVFDITHNPDIITSNPSPSGDPFWDVPENLAQLNEAVDELKHTDISKLKSYTSIEELKNDLGLCDDK